MAITVVADPEELTWDDFDDTPAHIRDPDDGTLVDAFTRFHYDCPDNPREGSATSLPSAIPT